MKRVCTILKQETVGIYQWPADMIHWGKILSIQTLSGTVGTFLFAGGDPWGV